MKEWINVYLLREQKKGLYLVQEVGSSGGQGPELGWVAQQDRYGPLIVQLTPHYTRTFLGAHYRGLFGEKKLKKGH